VERIPILSFPFAGGGAGVFRRCQEYPSDVLRICPVQLPGREQRFGEELCTTVDEAVEEVLPQALGLVGHARQVALFGHSLGAVLAYETAHRLCRIGYPGVVHLFVSGSPGPWTQRERRATGLSDEQFLERVREFAGYAHPALEHPELRELLLPILRADVAMHENHRPRWDTPLEAPITSIRGADDELVSAQDAAEWATATTQDCRMVELAGNHMYLVDAAAELVGVMEGVLSECAAVPTSRPGS
jgi:surfactin synthase thioesterase subunit